MLGDLCGFIDDGFGHAVYAVGSGPNSAGL